MDSQLRELIDHTRFHQGVVRAAAALLPADDAVLDAVIAETVAQGDQLGFIVITTAALDAGRRVDAAHLVGGTALAADTSRLGCFAWKMEGDVPAALMDAMMGVTMPREMDAAALFIVALWCRERRGGALPEGFAAEARQQARVKDMRKEPKAFLQGVALLTQDEGFFTVLYGEGWREKAEAVKPIVESFIQTCQKFYEGSPMDLVIAEPLRVLANGRTMRRSVEKISRNDPCHCGSKQKYKRCCFEKDQERLHLSSEVAGKTNAELRAEPEAGLTEPRLLKMPPFELVHLDPLKVPETLRRCYLKQVTGYMILDRSVEYLEVMEWNEDRKIEWVFVLFFIEMKQKKELAERMVALHTRYEPIEDLRYGIRLLLARDEPKEELTVLNEAALYIFREKDAEKLLKVANGILCSRHAALGILLSQRLITTLPIKEANSLLGQLLEARDKLNLTPDDPFADVLEKRLAEETHDEGKDATELRSARKRMEAKAEEVRQLKEEIERQRRALKSREKQQAAETPATTNGKVDEADVQEMRIKLSQLKATLHERAEERTGLRRALEKAHEDLQNLRHAAPANTAPAHDAAQEDEAEHYLPEQPAGNQPLRLVEFPAKFREALEDFPRHVARAALAMIGRLAGGEPAAFVGVVQLKAVHGVLRQRIGSEHRLLFRLHADRVQVLDLICRRDLDKRIKTLRFGG